MTPDDIDEPVIERLDADTVSGLRDRLLLATGFRELVARESEMDALFTLVDIAISAPPAVPLGAAIVCSKEELIDIRSLIFSAHDLTHDNDLKGAAELLDQVATRLRRPRH